jgi:hypothetical protein
MPNGDDRDYEPTIVERVQELVREKKELEAECRKLEKMVEDRDKKIEALTTSLKILRKEE